MTQPKDIFMNALDVKRKAETEAQTRKTSLRSMYEGALQELGYTEQQLRNNTDAMKQVAKLMFSEKYAGNEQYNKMLSTNPFYKGFSTTSQEKKQEIHGLALGIDYNVLLSQIDSGQIERFDDEVMTSIIGNINRSKIRNEVNSYINSQTTGDLFERKKTLSEIASQDPLIQGVSDRLDIPQLQNLVYGGVAGDYRRTDLEGRVGVTVPQYDFQRAA
ncbi:MAG: hypothetical protein ACMXYG_04420 [Candidatus Woesearchaeota archaeon]